MSEPMSSVEIEDVLSSIRRLVSEDLRPAARAQAPVPPRPAAPPEGGKLILTPALRVVPEDGGDDRSDAAQTEADDAGWAEAPAFHSIRHDAPATSTADSVAELGAAVDQIPDALRGDWETEEAGFVEVDEAPVAEVLTLDRFATDAPATLAADVAEAMGAAVDAPEPAPDLSDADWMPEHQQEWDDPADPVDAGADLVDAGPEMPGDDALDATRAWGDAAEAEVLRRLSEEAEQTVYRMDAAQEPVYDEDHLRELVRDIIREELQGALGERITRNVRKLVRAEISRALAVRDFE